MRLRGFAGSFFLFLLVGTAMSAMSYRWMSSSPASAPDKTAALERWMEREVAPAAMRVVRSLDGEPSAGTFADLDSSLMRFAPSFWGASDAHWNWDGAAMRITLVGGDAPDAEKRGFARDEWGNLFLVVVP